MRTLTTLVIILMVLWLMGCASHPQGRDPRLPFPKSLPKRQKVYRVEEVRCMGTGLGGCPTLLNQMTGRAQ